jgi:hypothetical protein
MPIRQATVPFRQGYNFGVGADLISGSPMAKVVDDHHSTVTQAGGAIVDFNVERVRTTHDLEESLGIDVDASYGSAAFGAGIEARFNFAKKSQIHTSSLFMTLTATVTLAFESIDDPALTSDASSLVDRQDLFENRFGNVFVRGLQRGGLFVGVLRIDTQSAEDSESISAQLEGSYGLFSAKASTNFQKISNDFQASTFIHMYHEGGPVDLALNDPSDPMELLRNVNLFLSSFRDQPDKVAIPYQVTLAPIGIAKGPLPLNAADLEQAEDVLVFCAKRRSALIDQLNLLQFMVDTPSRFIFSNSVSLATIRDLADQTQEDLDLIASCASLAIDSPAKAVRPATFATNTGGFFPKAIMPNPLPLPATAQITVPPWVGLDARLVLSGGADQDGTVFKSAGSLGFKTQMVIVPNQHGRDGEIASTVPGAGVSVPFGTTVILNVIDSE